MRIFGKLVLAFVTVSALTSVSALVGIHGIQRVQNAFNTISDGTVPELAFLGRLEGSAANLRTEALSIALLSLEALHQPGKSDMVAGEYEELHEASALFDRLIDESIKGRIRNGVPYQDLDQLKSVKHDLLMLATQVVEEVQHTHDPQTLTSHLQLLEDAEQQFAELLAVQTQKQLALLENRQADASQTAETALVLNIAMAVLSLVLAVLLGLVMARHVARPLESMSRTAKDFGEGVQDARVVVQSQDEIGELGAAFNEMANRLVATTITRDQLVNEVRERQWAEVQAQEAKKLADAANAAKGQFLANMSHEIRTPLNAIIGFSELLRDTPLNEQQSRYVGTILASGTGLLGIINDILDFSKIEAHSRVLESVDFDLGRLIHEVLDIASARLEPGGAVVLRSTYAPDLPQAFQGDPTALRQILINLVSNAIKFTEAGSVSILVDSAGVTEGGKHMVSLRVKDTGIGIPPDKIDQIFMLFAQADASTTRKYGGTGLGLAITRALSELMGGSIECLSEEGKGSEFVVHLPLPPARHPQLLSASHGNSTDDTLPHKPLRLLVAEDNLVNQTLAQAMLEKLGHSVVMVENGQLAVEQATHATFDVVLLDLHMPVMGGLEAARAIRALKPLQPIIALTAAALKEDRDQSLEAGMNDFLTKPLQLQELQAMLRKWT